MGLALDFKSALTRAPLLTGLQRGRRRRRRRRRSPSLHLEPRQPPGDVIPRHARDRRAADDDDVVEIEGQHPLAGHPSR